MAWKLFTLTLMEISKAEKSPWVKKQKQPAQKKRNSSTCQGKKKILAKSDKGSWFGQTPSTISASAGDPEHLNILRASSLKSKSATLQVVNEILHRNRAEAMKKKKNATLTVPNTGASILYCLVFSGTLYFWPMLCLCLWRLCPLYSVVILKWTPLSMIKIRVAMRCFSREILIYCHRH